MQRTLAALATAGALGIAIASSCGSSTTGTGSQTVAYTRTLARSADQPPECNPLRLITPSGASIWLNACGSGPDRESQVQDWTRQSLARQTAVMDGVRSLTPAHCPRSAPCVLVAQSSPSSIRIVAHAGPHAAADGSASAGDGTLATVAMPPDFPVPAASSTDEWQNVRTNNYWRDPSNGGAGTFVLNSAFTTSDAEDWVLQANSRCGFKVNASCPGGWISAHLQGAFVVTLRNVGQGSLCHGVSSSTNWAATMRTCDGAGGASTPSTVYAYTAQGCPGSTARATFTSFAWNSTHSTQGVLLDPEGGVNDNLIANDGAAHCFDFLWKFASS